MFFRGHWQPEEVLFVCHPSLASTWGAIYWKLLRVSILLLTSACLGDYCSAAEEQGVEKFQSELVRWEDSFREDTSGQYKIKGGTKFLVSGGGIAPEFDNRLRQDAQA